MHSLVYKMSTASKSGPIFSNLFDDIPNNADEEEFKVIAKSKGVVIERIVSHGHVSSEWYDQDETEFACVVRGEARMLFEGETEERLMRKSDWVVIPAHCKHKVTWTLDTEPTVWIAVKWS